MDDIPRKPGTAIMRSISDEQYGGENKLVRVIDVHPVHEPDGRFTQVHIELIKRAYASEGFTNEEFQVFLHVAQRRRLDPLAKQIYAIKRDGKMVIQTGIDGLRLAAVRSGQYAGIDDPVYLPADESTPQPRKATVTVYRRVNGIKEPFTASARWSEYAPADLSHKAAFMWKAKPYLMLGKVAEALAYRKAFPEELAESAWEPQLEYGSPAAAGGFLSPSGPPRTIAHDIKIVEAGNGVWIAQGNTMPSKDKLKELGFRWNAEQKQWGTNDSRIAARAVEFFAPTADYEKMPRALEEEGE